MYGNGKEFTHHSALIAIRDLNNLIDTMGSFIGTLDPTESMFKSLCSDYIGEGMTCTLTVNPGDYWGQLRLYFQGDQIIDHEVDVDYNGNLVSQNIYFTSTGLNTLIRHLEDCYVE